jgi:hypothetical protein
MPRALPATGSAKSMGRVRKAFFGSKPGAGSNIALRGTLGAQRGVTTGSVTMSGMGGYYAPYDTTDGDN